MSIDLCLWGQPEADSWGSLKAEPPRVLCHLVLSFILASLAARQRPADATALARPGPVTVHGSVPRVILDVRGTAILHRPAGYCSHHHHAHHCFPSASGLTGSLLARATAAPAAPYGAVQRVLFSTTVVFHHVKMP